jgi:protein-tyrosine phosphatase
MLNSFFKSIDQNYGASGDFSEKPSLKVDVHSHLLPGFDDGVDDFSQSIQVIASLQAIGYQKLILTPHIMKGYYEHKREDLVDCINELQRLVKKANIKIELSLAAEYYIDDFLFELLQSDSPLLTLDNEGKYLLVEAPFFYQKNNLIESVLKIQNAGYTPVLAHPERHSFFKDDVEILKRLAMSGVLFQVNINSLAGYYSKQAKQVAELLISNGLVSFLGTDCHNYSQLNYLKKAHQNPYFDIAQKQKNLLNNTLLNANIATKIPYVAA